jgi:hypothetical protein
MEDKNNKTLYNDKKRNIGENKRSVDNDVAHYSKGNEFETFVSREKKKRNNISKTRHKPDLLRVSPIIVAFYIAFSSTPLFFCILRCFTGTWLFI